MDAHALPWSLRQTFYDDDVGDLAAVVIDDHERVVEMVLDPLDRVVLNISKSALRLTGLLRDVTAIPRPDFKEVGRRGRERFREPEDVTALYRASVREVDVRLV